MLIHPTACIPYICTDCEPVHDDADKQMDASSKLVVTTSNVARHMGNNSMRLFDLWGAIPFPLYIYIVTRPDGFGNMGAIVSASSCTIEYATSCTQSVHSFAGRIVHNCARNVVRQLCTIVHNWCTGEVSCAGISAPIMHNCAQINAQLCTVCWRVGGKAREMRIICENRIHPRRG